MLPPFDDTKVKEAPGAQPLCERCEYSLVCVTHVQRRIYHTTPKIPLIKSYRALTGASLREAKTYVEEHMLCEKERRRKK
jgi:ribosomal protein L7/L12